MYAMYLRKSRADIEAEALGEMETLARHQKILTELAKRQGLVEQKTYDAAQKLFTASVPVNVDTVVANPFAGMLCCSSCGRKMAFQSYRHKAGNTKARIVHPESQFCKVKSAPFDEVMDALCERLESLVSDF